MRKLIIATVVVSLAGLSAADARGGMHGSGMHGPGMHGSGMPGLMAPANPTVPPSLTPDPRPYRNRAASTPSAADVGSFGSGRDAQTHP